MRAKYSLDAVVVAMLLAATFDCGTTWYFLLKKLGIEGNPVAAPLFRLSLLWIPIYLLSRPLLVPLLPPVSRRAFALFFLSMQTSMGINNLGGILTGDYFIVRRFGFWIPNAACIVPGITYFFFALRKCPSHEKYAELRASLRCLLFFSLIEIGFYLVGHI